MESLPFAKPKRKKKHIVKTVINCSIMIFELEGFFAFIKSICALDEDFLENQVHMLFYYIYHVYMI